MNLHHVARLLGGHVTGRNSVAIPTPGHSPRDRGTTITFLPDAPDGFLVHCFNGGEPLETKDRVRDALGIAEWRPGDGRDRRLHPAHVKTWDRVAVDAEAVEEQRKARWIWSMGQPIGGSIAETAYVREARRIACPLPSTLRFLPARNGYAPALMAAFGSATEPEPGVIAIEDEAVVGVHLIRLRPDGSGKADNPAKITIGRGFISPIVLAAPNDLLGLVIAEGIEDALSVHQSTGLGTWAASGAHRMPALAAAVPSWINCVTILVDDNAAGHENSTELAERLGRRGIYCELTDALGRIA